MQITKNNILELFNEHKALDIVSFDLMNKSSLADSMIIASGNSGRHVRALSDYVLKLLKEAGIKDIRVEGLDGCDWVLIDSGDHIINLFTPDSREFYDLASLWSDVSPRIVYTNTDAKEE